MNRGDYSWRYGQVGFYCHCEEFDDVAINDPTPESVQLGLTEGESTGDFVIRVGVLLFGPGG